MGEKAGGSQSRRENYVFQMNSDREMGTKGIEGILLGCLQRS